MIAMSEPSLIPAEIARARSVLKMAQWRVAQDVKAYGVAHVSKLNRARFVAAERHLGYLLGHLSASVGA